MLRNLRKHSLVMAAVASMTAVASAQTGPDVIVFTLGGGSGSSNYSEYGPVGGIYAYAMSTTSCNVGTAPLDWFDNGSSGNIENHPVIAQQAYRLLDGKFEQIGLAWLKHGFCALSQPNCGTCQGTDCDTLGIGCADTYGSGLNSGPGLGPRIGINSQSEEYVDAASGHHGHPFTGSGSGSITGRLQIHQEDIGNPGARYFFEAQYIAADDSAAGNHRNNASHREVSFSSPLSVVSVGPTIIEEPAIEAWRSIDPSVLIEKALVIDEGGAGAHGYYDVGVKVTDNGDGTWSYEYAVHNHCSNRSGASFSIPLPSGTNVTNIGFHDVDYHGPGAQDGTDWAPTVSANEIRWDVTQDYNTNPNANALRWATLYNFRFTADSSPGNIQGTIGLFKPGTPSEIPFFTTGPTGSVEPGMTVCFGDGSGAACPCGNTGGTGEGCATTTGSGMTISGSGSTSISADDLTMTADGVPLNNTGIFYSGTALSAGSPLFDGIQCAVGSAFRFSGQLATTSTVSDTGFVAQDTFGLYWVAGQTYNFHYYSRDNQAGPSPCGGFANLSPVYQVTMTP